MFYFNRNKKYKIDIYKKEGASIMEFKTFSGLNNSIIKNLDKIPKDIDIVVGVPRSGLLVANMIALYLNLPMCDIDTFLKGNMFACGTTKMTKKRIENIREAKKILVVEDSVATGKSILDVKNKLQNKYEYIKKIYMAVYVDEGAIDLVDIYFEICSPPQMFEWNYLHHHVLKYACVDIDGVLCRDPLPEEDDDGEKYITFIRNVSTKLLPTVEIGYLITARLEKYRSETEQWLKKNNIKYRHLIMMNLSSSAERQLLDNYALFKANEYKRHGETGLFIESDKKQASEIARLSGKCVFCVENQSVYSDSTLIQINIYTKAKMKRMIKKFFPSFIIEKLKRYRGAL